MTNMARTTITTKWGGETINVTADWAQASDQVQGDINGGFQVADFRHRPKAALAKALKQAAHADGLNLDDDETIDAIDSALDSAIETVNGVK